MKAYVLYGRAKKTKVNKAPLSASSSEEDDTAGSMCDSAEDKVQPTQGKGRPAAVKGRGKTFQGKVEKGQGKSVCQKATEENLVQNMSTLKTARLR